MSSPDPLKKAGQTPVKKAGQTPGIACWLSARVASDNPGEGRVKIATNVLIVLCVRVQWGGARATGSSRPHRNVDRSLDVSQLAVSS